MNRRFSVVALAVVLLRGVAFGDSWMAPQKERWSEDGTFLLRTEVEKKTIALEEKTAKGLVERWSMVYPEKDARMPAPVWWHVTKDGKYVVLRDHWGQIGYGDVLVFLGPSGQVLARYTLKQVLPESEIAAATHSVSSLHWNENAVFFIREPQKQFEFITSAGTMRLFDLTNGSMINLTAGAAADIRHQNLLEARRMVLSKDPIVRMAGADRLGVLHDHESVPKLKELLTDPGATRVIPANSTREEDRWYGVQLSAGKALLRIIGDEAVPILEARQAKLSKIMVATWRAMVREYKRGMHRKTRE